MTMPEINRRQAMVPRGAIVLENANGTAPGLWIERGGTGDRRCCPGPPREMTPMLDAVIDERLAAAAAGAGLFRRVLKITGRTESDVDARGAAGLRRDGSSSAVPITTTILAVIGQIELHLTASRAEPARRPTRRSMRPSRELQAALGAVDLQRRTADRSKRSSAICCAARAGRSRSPSRAPAGCCRRG